MLKMNLVKNNSNPLHINIQRFLLDFFKGHFCDVVVEDKMLKVQLTKEMDMALMNRPFYWQYVETTGNQGQPMELTFKLNPNLDKGEWIHYGSPRFQQICTHLKKSGKFTLLYEMVDVQQNTMLHPWLLTNFCITYEGKQIKEEIMSIGLNLINGTFIFDMMEHFKKRNFKPTLSDRCYTISPLIKLTRGFLRDEKDIQEHIIEQDHQWAVESLKLLQEELDMIEHFFKDKEQELEKEKADIMSRLQPKISYEVWNGGILYLT